MTNSKYINIHRPPHVFIDNAKYFITSRTVNWVQILDNDNKKQVLYECIFKALEEYNYICDSWVILSNHYQLVIDVKASKSLPLFIKKINGSSSRLLNKIDNCQGRKVWDQYWDKILDNDKSYWTHINYNHHNPVKHGYVSKMGAYKWSDFNEHIKKYGEESVYERFESYPIIDFTPPGEGDKEHTEVCRSISTWNHRL
jgi:putative transposase